MREKHSPYLVAGIIMLGAVMRAPFTSVPAILTDIAAGLGIPVSGLGVLTSLPLLMFAIFSAWAPKWAEKQGQERLLGCVLLLMGVGSFLRILNLPMLYVGTMLVGIAVAVINVLLPSLISVNFPLKVGFYTTLYLTTMGCSATLASMVAVPITEATSWQTYILLVTGLILLANLLWLPNWRNNHRFERKKSSEPQSSLWKNKSALVFLLFGGLQSLLYYTEMTWLPTIAQSSGLSKAQAGLVAGVFSLISIPISMTIPSLVVRLKKEQRALLMTLFSAVTLAGLGMAAVAPANMGFWLLIALLLGVSVSTLFPYMMISFSLKTSNSQDTARLSGMVQSGGYLLASVGPLVLGYSQSLFGSWIPLLLGLMVVTVGMVWMIWLIEKKDKIL